MAQKRLQVSFNAEEIDLYESLGLKTPLDIFAKQAFHEKLVETQALMKKEGKK